MTVRKIKGKQGPKWCDFCPPKSVAARWRGYAWGKHACQDHLGSLEAWDRQAQQPDYSDAQFVGGY